MSTYKQIIYQTVFSTKHRKPTIADSHCEELYKYISGVVKSQKCHLYRINGIEDHIHIISDLHPTVALANFIKEIKIASSLWMKQCGLFPDFEGWQDGYGSFTYNVQEKHNLIEYVKNQKEHHKKESFYDEFKRLLIENEIEFDERYLL